MKHSRHITAIVLSMLLGFLCFPRQAAAQTKVGTPAGSFSVSSLGGAVYSIAIECPPGIGGMVPRLSLAYNSQSGMGLAGYGVNIGGISAITRAPHDLFHDGSVRGMEFMNNDALFLDGRRLIPNYTNYNGGTYFTVEGDPFTQVTRHGEYSSTVADTWFEVKDRNGMTYIYGATADSRQSYVNGNGNPRIYSWYISSAEDANSNYISYTYAQSNHYVRPTKVSYGMNRAAGRTYGLCTVEFEYEALGTDAQPFVMEDIQGQLDMRLKSIKSKTYGEVYRQYDLAYSNTIDSSPTKFARLTTVTEKNGEGEAMNPVIFNWLGLPDNTAYQTTLNVSLEDDNPNVEKEDMRLVSIDLNGDGLDEIVRLSCVKENLGMGAYSNYTVLYVSCSQIDQDGNITYSSPLKYNFGAQLTDEDMASVIGGSSVVDFDGDGFNDLLIPRLSIVGSSKMMNFLFVSGRHVALGQPVIANYNRPLLSSSEIPLIASIDINGNGRSDMLFLEKSKSGQSYPGRVVKVVDTSSGQLEDLTFSLSLPHTPKRLFVADFNNDGLQDLIVFHESGYKVFLNQAETSIFGQFSDLHTVSGTNVTDSWRMEPGDFNGDGLTDFLFIQNEDPELFFALNLGDGTFDVNKAADLDHSDQNTGLDDDRFTFLVNDFDCDGRSDVVVVKAAYEHRGFPHFDTHYTSTFVRWLRSTGSALTLYRSAQSQGEDDALSGHLTLGDFDGDGYRELLSYGNSLISSTTTDNPLLHLYKTGSDMPSKGKVCTVTDGLGRTTAIQYKSLSSPSVYQPVGGTAYPLSERVMPLHVVSQATQSNGAAGSATTEYSYGGLTMHVAGKGLLGFTTTEVDNTTTGQRIVSTVGEWDTVHWTPVLTTTQAFSGSAMATTQTASTAITANRNYLSCPQTVTETDADGNVTQTTYTYDTGYGVPLTVTQTADGGAYSRATAFSNYQTVGQQRLPRTVTTTSKHPDDAASFTDVTTCTYDSVGRVLTRTEHSGTPVALTTTSTYDAFGNCLTSQQSGSGVPSTVTTRAYDYYGRFLTSVRTSDGAEWISYTRDTWGNVTNRRDDAATTTEDTYYTYDGWGTLLTETSPLGLVTTYSEGWVNDGYKKYFKYMTAQGQPWERVWFDEQGRELQRQSLGPKGMTIGSTTSYDSRGNVIGTTATTGSLTQTETLTYDERGRVLSDVLSTGRTTAYSYGNRMVTTTVNGHEYTRTFDAWGNVKTAADTLATVSYSYYSSGLPSSVTSEGATVTMQYDQAGRRTSLSDPDAGTTTSTWTADGRLLSQTDARGITTTYTYNDIGMPVTVQSGSLSTAYTYGNNGAARCLPRTVTMGGNTITYTRDGHDRVTAETRQFADGTQFSYAYTYNANGQLSEATLPGGLTVGYSYEGNGFPTAMTADGQEVWRHVTCNGVRDSSVCLGTVRRTAMRDANGNLTMLRWQKDSHTETNTYTFDGATGNLLRRSLPMMAPVPIDPGPIVQSLTGDGLQDFIPFPDSIGITHGITPGLFEYEATYGYDALDRLTSVGGAATNMSISYAPNGNILSKSGVGSYGYDATQQPHAVKCIGNHASSFPTATLETTFGDLGKIITIAQDSLETTFTYGPDGERWKSVLTSGDDVTRTIRYGGDYERVEEAGTTTEFWYLGHGIVVMRQDGGQYVPLVAVTDHLGSVEQLRDDAWGVKFYAHYDAWGKPDVDVNYIHFQRGYTGHEMLPEYGLINMNGRMYDPLLGRFLSPDNYVQQPDNSQNFNRYSYCLNNPLKYKDPDGELFGFVTLNAIYETIKGIINHGFNVSQYSYRQTRNAVKLDKALVSGDFWDVVGKWTWNSLNTFVGHYSANVLNLIGMVDDVTIMDGAAAVGGVTGDSINESAFTLGPFIFGPDGFKADWRDELFVHEYGHYRQSLVYGFAYLPVIGLPSALSNLGIGSTSDDKQLRRWFEIDASKRGARHFDKYYGRGREGYTPNDPNYFDLQSFVTGNSSPYFNPRTNKDTDNAPNPISNQRNNWTDVAIPLSFPVLFFILYF